MYFNMLKQEMPSADSSGVKVPRCSVVMPVYNTREDYFREAIESILEQRFADFEFIIVDNASEPGVRSVVEDYDDPRIIYLRLEENWGASHARNHGIEAARGEFIAFMDSDDISLPTRLEKQVRYLDTHPQVGCLGSGFAELSGGAFVPHSLDYESSSSIECELLLVGCVMLQSSIMLRRSLLGKGEGAVLYKREYYPAEDYALLLDLIGKTEYAVLPEALVNYRRNSESVSHMRRHEQLERKRAAQRQALQRICGAESGRYSLLVRFLHDEALSSGELKELAALCAAFIRTLECGGYPVQDVQRALRKAIRKSYYHTRSLRGQWALMRSQLHSMFHLSFGWRLWCLVTRGFF